MHFFPLHILDFPWQVPVCPLPLPMSFPLLQLQSSLMSLTRIPEDWHASGENGWSERCGRGEGKLWGEKAEEKLSGSKGIPEQHLMAHDRLLPLSTKGRHYNFLQIGNSFFKRFGFEYVCTCTQKVMGLAQLVCLSPHLPPNMSTLLATPYFP